MQNQDTHKPSLIKRIFVALWHFINNFRKLILNVIFFFILFAFVASLANKKEPINIEKSTALVLNLQGELVEQKRKISPTDAFIKETLGEKEKRPEILMSDLLKTIRKAQKDQRITLLVLELSQLTGSGLTKLREVAKALTEFKAAGKKIIAIGDGFTQNQYYLASYANEIWLNPQGWLLLEGYGHFPMYYKSALDKLNIKQHIFRVGTYKSAVEPFMRDNMSPAAKEASSLWLNELWLTYKQDVAKQRGFTIDNFDETAASIVNKFEKNGSNFAEYALNNHWVDALKTREQMRNDLIAMVGKNKKGTSFKQVSFADYFKSMPPKLPFKNNKDKVAVIVAKGAILNGEQDAGQIGGDSTARLLRKARQNKQVKAVVLRVDSPGGSSYASEIIRQEVELLKAAGKPVIASMGTYGASGGYWISAAADKIYAAPTTITGSIGIFGMMMTFDEALDKLGIHTDGVGTTEFAGFSPTRPLPEGIAKLFQLNINRGYQDFINLVAENRHMTPAQVDKIAQGRVWTGAKAHELGLIDELGNLDDAIKAAAKLAKLDNYEMLLVEQEISPRDIMLQKIFGQAHVWLTRLGINIAEHHSANNTIDKFITSMSTELNKLKQFNDPQGVYSFCGYCEIE